MAKKGMKSYDEKEKRRIRRRNHFARDLSSPLFRQRRKEGRKPPPPEPDIDDWEI